MVGKVLEVRDLLDKDDLASEIANMYERWNNDRQGWLDEKTELRNYIFATDTTTTTNSKLPWKNTTTVPKLCQIRDNLHANYMAALFYGDNWFEWKGEDDESSDSTIKQKIEAYMREKLRRSEFKSTISKLLYDYIDTGNVVCEIPYIEEYGTDPETGEQIPNYIGPKLSRLSIYDIVFNPLASDFKSSPKITRYTKSIGDLERDLKEVKSEEFNQEAINKALRIRHEITNYSRSDVNKATGFTVDGFGSMHEYFTSGYVELLVFKGDIYDSENGILKKNHQIVVLDRLWVIYDKPLETWFSFPEILHSGWRYRPDNLYAMGPLDNLVGMQYRIDHLENLKADAMDLLVFPPLKIKGDVEEFTYGPLEEINVGDDGDVAPMVGDLNAVVSAQLEIDRLEQKMEEMAGAPKQAMGFRTPGEKTLGEVMSLENAASRIFQEKISQFERDVIEPALNIFLAKAKKYMTGVEMVPVQEDSFGADVFIEVSKEDLTAKGRLIATGARHFAATLQLVNNLLQALNTPAGQDPSIMAHVSKKKIAQLLFEELPGLNRFDLVSDNIGLLEQADTQRIMMQLQEDLQAEQQLPSEPGIEDLPSAE